jgi:S-adenosylmethionine decarboxylase
MITQRFHYIFDAWGLSPKVLNSKKTVESLLRDTARICKMNIIGGPLIVRPPVYTPPGLSGFCIIDFSHISIHTFSQPGEVCVDIFSCKSFNPEEVKSYLLKKLKVSEKNLYFFQVHYPAGNPKNPPAKIVSAKFRQLQMVAAK